MGDDVECPECTNCEGNTHLGTLGRTDHYRCRSCGWDWHEPARVDRDPLDALDYLNDMRKDPNYDRDPE